MLNHRRSRRAAARSAEAGPGAAGLLAQFDGMPQGAVPEQPGGVPEQLGPSPEQPGGVPEQPGPVPGQPSFTELLGGAERVRPALFPDVDAQAPLPEADFGAPLPDGGFGAPAPGADGPSPPLYRVPEQFPGPDEHRPEPEPPEPERPPSRRSRRPAAEPPPPPPPDLTAFERPVHSQPGVPRLGPDIPRPGPDAPAARSRRQRGPNRDRTSAPDPGYAASSPAWAEHPQSARARIGRRRGEVMDQLQDPAGPVAVLVDGIIRRDEGCVRSVLAPQVRLSVPPLRFSCSGQAEALGAIEAVLAAFPDLDYQLRSRYVAPGEVTDEVLLTGTHQQSLLGVTPTGKTGQVLARIRMTHDGSVVTSLGLWADSGALREVIAIPAGPVGVSNSVVSALRATLPAGEQRLIIGTGREPEGAPRKEVLASPVAAPAKTSSGRGEVRAPVPRRTRRRRAIALGTGMVAASVALVTWVLSGTLHSTAASGTLPPEPTTVAQQPRPTPTSAPAQTPSSSPEPGVTFNPENRTYNLSADVLFGFNSTRLTPRAKEILNSLIASFRQTDPSGEILVTGYTDSRGGVAYNKRLSLRRAEAVANFLSAGLRDLPVTVLPVGAGESDPVSSNDTDTGRAANRRVTVRLPPPPSPTAAGSAASAGSTGPAGGTASASAGRNTSAGSGAPSTGFTATSP